MQKSQVAAGMQPGTWGLQVIYIRKIEVKNSGSEDSEVKEKLDQYQRKKTRKKFGRHMSSGRRKSSYQMD